MNVTAIVSSLRYGTELDRTLKVLFNFDSPVTERESEALAQFARDRHLAIEAGGTVPDIPATIAPLLHKPSTALSPTFILQCVLGISKLPAFPSNIRRAMMKQLPLQVVKRNPKVDWAPLLLNSFNQLEQWGTSSPNTVRTCEMFLALSSKHVNTTQPGDDASITETWMRLLCAVIKYSAAGHISCKSQKDCSKKSCIFIAAGNASFLTSDVFLRFERIISCGAAFPAVVLEAKSSRRSSGEQFILQLLLNRVALRGSNKQSSDASIQNTLIPALVKDCPAGFVRLFISPAGGAGRITVDDAAAAISFILNKLALTTTTQANAEDLIALFSALPMSDVREYFEGKTRDDALTQLVDLFVSNHAVFHHAVAESACEIFADSISAFAAPVFDALIKVVASTLQSKCRSGDEKASVMNLLSAVIRASCASSGGGKVAPVLPQATKDAIALTVKAQLDSPAAEASAAAFKLAGAADCFASLKPVLAPLYKTANNGSNDTLRRNLLLHLAPQDDCAVVTKELLSECEAVETYRPDAYLSLMFTTGASVATGKILKIANSPSVLLQFDNSAEQLRAVAVSIALAQRGCFEPITLMLTHKSGLVRRAAREFVSASSGDPSVLSSLWDVVTKSIFGIDEATRPTILSESAVDALEPVASALLKFPSRIQIDAILSEVILCCGHEFVQGDDQLYTTPNSQAVGKYRTSSTQVNDRVFARIIKPFLHLITLHMTSIANTLTKKLSSAPHVAAAAGRALTLLLTRASPLTTTHVFKLILQMMKASADKLRSLPPMDSAIASGSPQVLADFISKNLTDKNLLKVYTPKPPKGVSEEDYEDSKRKDVVALEKGRIALNEEISKRRATLADQIFSTMSPFACLRVIGNTGKYKLEGLPVVYPFLLSVLADTTAPAALRNFTRDTVTGLLSKTNLGAIAPHIVDLTARLFHGVRDSVNLTPSDISLLNAVAMYLRQTLTHMLPSPLLTVMQPFFAVAFRSSKSKNAKFISGAAQHQLLSILVTSIGQAGLPNPVEITQLLFDILQNFQSLYKTILTGLSAIASYLPIEALEPIYNAVMRGTDLVKEAGAIAFSKTQFFAHRRAILIAAALSFDTTNSIVAISKNILSHHDFVIDVSDWEEITEIQRIFSTHDGSVRRIGLMMKSLLVKFPSSQNTWLARIIAVGGTSAVRIIELISPVLTAASVAISLNFLCDVAEHSASSEALLHMVLSTGKVLLSTCSAETLNAVTVPVQQRLRKPPVGATAQQKELYNAIVVVWLTILATRVNDIPFLEATIEQQAQVLATSNTSMVHDFVCESMADIARNKSVQQSEKLATFATNCVKVALTSGAYGKKKAHACGLAGVVLGLGVKSLRRFNIISQIVAASKDKNQPQRSGAMILIELLADVLGYAFEPFALTLIPQLLENVTEKDSKISECADDAAKAVMRNLSDIGLRQLIPRLVEGLSSDQTKKRTPSLNFIGYVAFCSPQQLAATLPFIMGKICECLFDANSSVSNAAFNALKKVAGVVSNPEIQEHVELILVAMRSPSTETEAALDALLYTRFVNAVDPASLALIVPVIARGLADQMYGTKGKSAQIIASMVSLVADTKTLIPYAPELVKRLESAAQDPQNEIRSTSSKAIAALCATIRGDILDGVMEWLFTILRRTSSSAEKAGSAQVLVEVVAACGVHILEQCYGQIEEGMNHESASVKESFMHIMVYAPATLPTVVFQDFLPSAFPWVLRGLSDINERVRTVSLLAGSNIIGLYGTRNLALVLHPLLEGVISEVSNLRQSSMLLAAKLLIHLVTQIKRKMRIESPDEVIAENPETNEFAEETEDNSLIQGGEVQVETARDAEKRGVSILGSLEEQIGTEHFIRVISAMHIGRAEHSLVVRTEVSTAWQVCVASPRGAISKVFTGIISMLTKFGSSANPECVDVACKCIDYTCARMNEMLEKFINAFADEYKVGTRRHKIGALVCLSSVVPFGDAARIMKIGGQIVGCVLPAMQDDDEQIQRQGGILFERVTKIVGSRLIESVIESQIDGSVRGVIEVVKVRPVAALAVIFKIMDARKAFTINDLDLLESIMELEDEIEDQDMAKYLERMSDIVLRCVVQGVEGAEDTMTKLAEFLPDESAHLPLDLVLKAQKKPEARVGAIRAAAAYALGVNTAHVDNIEAVIRILLGAFGDADPSIRQIAVDGLIQLLTSLDKRVIDELDESEKSDHITAKRTAGRYSLQFLEVIQTTLAVTAGAFITTDEPEFAALSLPKIFDTFLNFYARALDYGTAPQKIQSVECIQELLQFAPHSIGGAAVTTVSGKCSKVLFVRNEGSVVAALVRLCLQLMKYPAGGKEKMIDSTLATAMFTAELCDSNEARALVLRVVVQIIRRNPAFGEIILGTVVSKKNAIDTPTFRGVMCRFISTVMRHARIEKKAAHVATLLGLVRPIWDTPESMVNSAASGSAIGSLCISTTISDDEVISIAETAIARANARGIQAIGGLSCIYSLALSVSHRLPAAIMATMVETVQKSAAYAASDKTASLWVLRAGAALAAHPTCTPLMKPEAFHILLKRIDNNADEQLASSASYFTSTLCEKIPKCASGLDSFGLFDQSTQWGWIEKFDADMDDEASSENLY